jgi:hypothetical protein
MESIRHKLNKHTVLAIAFVLGATGANAHPRTTTVPSSCSGYPYGTAPSRTSVAFSESDTLQAFSSNFAAAGGTISAWYSDEHALTLGVRQVVVKTAKGSTTVDYSGSFTPFNSKTLSAVSPNAPLPVGTTALSGALAGTDLATWNSSFGFLDHGRPIWPALFLTDTTFDPGNTAGDWQSSGISAIPPNAVYGTWKGAVRTVDQTRTPWVVSITPDADPSQNSWNGIPDAPPGGFGRSEGYSTELVWNVDSLGLTPGHSYRMQFMMHDGDQNKAGGDVGEACVMMVVQPAAPPAS